MGQGPRTAASGSDAAGVGPSFSDFAHATLNFRLHPWQEQVLCPLIERLVNERGLRVAVHAPPQYGKSVLLSQRGPAWILGRDPLHRIGLAAYNETHASGFGSVIRDLMLTPQYTEQFPDPRCRVRADSAAGKFFTAARQAVNDAQPSFLALGLQSGFTGKGVDTLIIDDPYKSAEEANSEAINGKVWRFWKETASVRIEAGANVVVMFHRYHLDDLAGKLLREGGWEYIRLPAIADANEDGSDPTRRTPGELLSLKHSREWLKAQEDTNSLTFLGQFQGRPLPPEGALFKVANLKDLPAPPAGLRSVRAWDKAATGGGGDYTAGVKMATDGEGRFYVLDVKRGQWSTDERDGEIRQTAVLDTRSVSILGPQDPGSAGKSDAQAFTRLLAGFTVRTEPISGDKVVRAGPFSSQVNAGNVYLVEGAWNGPFVEELRAFPLGTHDDQVDAASDAFNALQEPQDPRGSLKSALAGGGIKGWTPRR